MIMSACHNNPGFMRTALISLLIIISQQISSCSGQDVCVRLENWVIQVPEGNTTGQVLKSVNVTTTVAHSLDLTLENAGPDVLSLVEQDNNLKIVVNTNLDAENASRPNIQYQLTCTSIGRPLHYQLKLVVVDENDNYPVFNERLKTSLNESLSVGSEVYRLENKATDADITENAITYSITAQDPLYNNTFEISGLSSIGSVILKSPLDYDSGQRQYLLVVTASDNQKSSTATLTINVEDVDDQNPVFNNTGRYIWNVEENTTQTFFQVSAYDPDTGVLPKPMIKYNLITDYGMFSINESTGIITPSRPLDREQNQTLYLFVQAYQDDKPSFRVASKLLEVKVEDVNDNPPVMSPLSYTKSLSENTASGVVVLQVSGSDADQGVNAQFHYHINRTDQINNAFIINPTTGEITVNDSNVLDAEKTEEFNFKVFAREVNTVEKRESQEASVRITLLDMNDNSPLFNKSHYEFTINETLPVGSFIGRVFATDADSKDYGDIVYNLENSASSLPFEVDRVTGNLTVHGNISVGTFTLYVTASDQPQTTAPRRSTVQVKIQVLDVNNHKPRFTSLQRTFNVTEGTENYLLTYLLVEDEDSIDNLHCDLLAGDGTKFDVRFSDDIAGCSVKVIGDIDREATPEYNLTVQVSDGLHNDTAVLSVRVIDANDNSPIFTLPVFNFTVTEGIYAGLLVGKVQATDADVGVNGQIKYTLENVLQGWTIEEDSGNISFTGKLDAENQQILQLLVKAADSGQQSLINVTRVLITVSDINDNSPVCNPESVNLWMKENTPKKLLYDAGAICSDADVALENRETVFRIASGNESLFGVSEDGRLFTKKTLLLDSNSLTGYNITLEVYNIRAYSNDSLRNATLHVYLRLVDVNNEAPVFTKSEYRFSVNENSPVDSIVGSVIATDGDSSAENSAVFYTITGGNTQGFFKMNSESGQITVNTSFDYEQLVSKNFSLQVQAVNGDPSATPGRSGSADVIITILDINDATPMFSKTASPTPATRSDVICGQEGIRVEIPLSQLEGDDFTLQDPKCSLTVSDGKLVADFGFSDCGTMADFTDDAIIFKNFITPLRVGDSVPIICKYPRHKNVTLPYKIAQRSVRFYEKGLGSLEMVMRQFSSSGYQTEIQASSYPIFINSEEPVYLEVRVTGSMSDGLAVFPTKCLASASASPTNDTNAREIIKDGCKTDTSVVIYPSSAGKLRFRFNAFSLTPKSSVTYVHCEMLVCSVLDRSSKCHNDCSGSGDTMRAKRSLQATAEHNGHFVSSGPLVLDKNQSGTGSSLVAVFGVVAVVSMVVSVVAVAVATVTERRRRTKSRDIN